MTLLFLRHGQTDWCAQGRFKGRTDIPLNETGRVQAYEQAAALTKQRIDAIYASPMKRAAETAQIIAKALGLPVYYDERLVERDMGAIEGTIATHWLEEVEIEQACGENLDVFYDRVRACLDELRAAHTEQTVLVVAHGFVASMVHHYVHGMDESDAAEYGNAVLRKYEVK